MNTIFKVMAFAMMLNFATGIMMEAIPIFNENPSTSGGVTYDSSLSDGFVNNLEDDINPSGVLEDEGNAIYRVLDMLNIGFISKFLETIKQYLFGFINLFDKILGRHLIGDYSGLHTLLFGDTFGILYMLMTLGYIWGALSLWTGKNLTGD